MLIKDAKYKKVRRTTNVRVSHEVYGCDECRKEIKNYPNETSRLEVRVFHHQAEADHLHFCSWKCVFKHLPKVKTDYFVDLPFIHFDTPVRNSKEFFKALKSKRLKP